MGVEAVERSRCAVVSLACLPTFPADLTQRLRRQWQRYVPRLPDPPLVRSLPPPAGLAGHNRHRCTGIASMTPCGVKAPPQRPENTFFSTRGVPPSNCDSPICRIIFVAGPPTTLKFERNLDPIITNQWRRRQENNLQTSVSINHIYETAISPTAMLLYSAEFARPKTPQWAGDTRAWHIAKAWLALVHSALPTSITELLCSLCFPYSGYPASSVG